MRKRDLAFIITAMACFSLALASLILFQMQASTRAERNVAILCDKLTEINGKPCDLVQPSEAETRLFAFIRRH